MILEGVGNDKCEYCKYKRLYLGCMVTLVNDDEGKVGNLEVAPGEGVQQHLVDHHQHLAAGHLLRPPRLVPVINTLTRK